MNSTGWLAWCTARAGTGVFPPQQGAELCAVVRQAPEGFGLPRPRWRLADLRAVVPWLREYSLSGISQALTRLGVRHTHGRFALHRPDPDYQPKLAAIDQAVARARAAPARVRVLDADELTLVRQPSLGLVSAPRGHEPTVPLTTEPNYTYRDAGALDLITGQVWWLGAQQVGVDRLMRFLRRLRAAYPTQERSLVWDNWPVHRHPAVLAVAAALGITILWLPTYAAWTNPIEKLWRWLKQDVVVAHRLAEQWGELKGHVAAFLDQFADGSEALLRYVGLLPDQVVKLHKSPGSPPKPANEV